MCPTGIPLASKAYSANLAHIGVECSHQGLCDYDTGLCDCAEGFRGQACEKLECDCSGHGRCIGIDDFDELYSNGAQFLGTWSSTTLTVSSIISGKLSIGQEVKGEGIVAGTTITAMYTLTGSLTGNGGIGTYTISQTPVDDVAVITCTGTWSTTSTTLTVASPSSNTLKIGGVLSGAGIRAGTTIVALGTGTGGAAVYYVNDASHCWD